MLFGFKQKNNKIITVKDSSIEEAFENKGVMFDDEFNIICPVKKKESDNNAKF